MAANFIFYRFKFFFLILSFFLFTYLTLLPVYAKQPISQDRKSTTLSYIQKVKQSLGIDKVNLIEDINKSENISFISRERIDTESPTSTKLTKVRTKGQIRERGKDSYDRKSSRIRLARRGTVSHGRFNGIIVKYLGTSQEEMYPAEEKGSNVVTILEPYHPGHKGLTIPYYKDREGLKIHPWVGIRGEYKQDEQLVGIESLILEAKEFGQTTDAQLRDYISTNDKHYTRGEIILHYKETWPKFTFIHHNERVTREYDAKKLWNNNKVYYDHYDKKYYKLEYTIPNLPRIGYLKLTGRYGSGKGYKPNDNAAYTPFDSYQLTLKCMPFYDMTMKALLRYAEGDKPRYSNIDDWKENVLELEFKKLFPRLYLTITPYYKWEDEDHFPVEDNSEWITHKSGIKIEKELNGNLDFSTDLTYINYARDKQRETSNYSHISVRALSAENDITCEFVRDLKLTLGLDCAISTDEFDGFDNYTVRGELMYRKPGLADYRIGLRHTEYYNIDDSLDTLYFKIGFFM